MLVRLRGKKNSMHTDVYVGMELSLQEGVGIEFADWAAEGVR